MNGFILMAAQGKCKPRRMPGGVARSCPRARLGRPTNLATAARGSVSVRR